MHLRNYALRLPALLPLLLAWLAVTATLICLLSSFANLHCCEFVVASKAQLLEYAARDAP